MKLIADYGDCGLVEATRAELARFFPAGITDQLPEESHRYAWGKFEVMGCGCPVTQAFPDISRSAPHSPHRGYWDEITDYDRACMQLPGEVTP